MKSILSLAVAQLALPLVLVGPALAADVESTVLQLGSARNDFATANPAGGVSATAFSSNSVSVLGFAQTGGQYGFGAAFFFNIAAAEIEPNFYSLATTPVSGEEPDVVSLSPFFSIGTGPSTAYLTLSTGGTYHNGEIIQFVSGTTPSTFYTFAGNTDGNKPKSPALPLGGSLGVLSSAMYGGTGYGVLNNKTPNNGDLITHMFSFTDGAYPSGTLTEDSNSVVYGTTQGGGAYGFGTVYKVANPFTVLCSFKGGADGETPVGGVTVDSAGNVYGSTEYGGTGGGQGNGTIFKIAPDGTKTTLYSMDRYTGTHPTGNLVLSPAGDLYGTTSQLGAKPVPGEIFKVTQAGVGSVVHRFAATDGYGPLPQIASVELHDVFTIIGATASGGTNNAGVVFKVAVTQ